MLLIDDARRQLARLAAFMDEFAGCFGREAQRDAARRYVRGLLSASERKSIQAMSAGRSNAEYQRVHHFISEAPWNGAEIWRRVRTKAIDRSGVIVIDDTGFAKQGPRSVAVARQYCPPLGKVANCQIAVTSVLRSSRSTWLLGMDLYVPQDWIDDPERRERALVPESVVAKKKWELALGQIGRAKRDGFEIRGVAADAGYGDIGAFRDGIAKLGLRYVVRCGGRQIAFLERPRISSQKRRRGKRLELALGRGSAQPMTLKQIAASLPDRGFRRVTWGKGSKGPMRIRVTALRIFLAPGWRDGEKPKECWLLVRRKRDGSHKLYVSNLPPSATLVELVRIAYSRWAVEQSYQQLKDDLGFDHLECRSWVAWNHHAALSALAFTFLGIERRRSRLAKLPTIPAARRVISRLALAMTVVEDPEMRELVTSFARDPPRF